MVGRGQNRCERILAQAKGKAMCAGAGCRGSGNLCAMQGRGQDEAAVMRAEKRHVARNSVLAAVFITLFKIVVGVLSGSLGILSEALHSSLDLVSSVVTLFSVRVSDKPADAEHQYGHGKIENLSAFIEIVLLLFTCGWIVWEAIQRLFFRTAKVEPNAWAFLVMAMCIGIDVWRSRALKRVADKYHSQALQADALNFTTDIWSSAVVILGLGLVWAGKAYRQPWMLKADPVAALCVAIFVIWVSARLARQTIDGLLDAAPGGVRASILDEVEHVPGVLEIERVRIRKAGNRYFVDISIGLARNVTFQASSRVSAEVTDCIHRLLGEADVLVTTTPRAVDSESIYDRIRAAALRNNVMVHDISVQDEGGRLHVELHLELDEKLSLIDAHEMVTLLEQDIRDHVPEIESILTHIESEPATIEASQAVEEVRASVP